MTLQLLACLARVQLLVACSRKSSVRSNRKSVVFLAHSWAFLHTILLTTLTRISPKYRVTNYWNKANLAQNKANKMVDNIQPYTQLLVGYVLANETIYLIKKKKKWTYIWDDMLVWASLLCFFFFEKILIMLNVLLYTILNWYITYLIRLKYQFYCRHQHFNYYLKF